MATRKQRSRRAKTFRHEYETVLIDAEGNESPVERVAREKPEKTVAASKNGKKAAKGKARPPRPIREVPAPTWNRALKRGGLFGVLFLVVFASIGWPIALAVIYGVMFIPLTYWTDRLAYRTYLRRAGLAPPKQPSARKG